MDGSTETPRDPSPAPRLDTQSTLAGAAAPLAPSGVPHDYVARCCRVTVEHSAQATRQNFIGSPHYFGDYEDTGRRSKNQAEIRRRQEGGYCFKCRMSDIKDVPFLECPLYGALVTAPTAATVGRTRCTPKRA